MIVKPLCDFLVYFEGICDLETHARGELFEEETCVHHHCGMFFFYVRGLRPLWCVPFFLDLRCMPFPLFSQGHGIHHRFLCSVTLGSGDRPREEGCHGGGVYSFFPGFQGIPCRNRSLCTTTKHILPLPWQSVVLMRTPSLYHIHTSEANYFHQGNMSSLRQSTAMSMTHLWLRLRI